MVTGSVGLPFINRRPRLAMVFGNSPVAIEFVETEFV